MKTEWGMAKGLARDIIANLNEIDKIEKSKEIFFQLDRNALLMKTYKTFGSIKEEPF